MFTPTKRQAGQGVEHVARKFQILTALYDQRQSSNDAKVASGDGLTLGKIAKLIGVSRSPHLRRLMETLYLEGAVTYDLKPYRKNVNMVVWYIDPKARWLAPYCPLFDAYLGEGEHA